MKAVLNVLEEFADKDCFDRISDSSSKPRTLTKTDYERHYEVPATELRCMISGISSAATSSSATPKSPITLSHLLPRSTEAKEKLSLGYGRDDIENIRNSLILCNGFEYAFDHKFISFVPSDKPFSENKYKLHIWVDNVRTDPIYEGSDLTIGSFDGAALNLTVGRHVHYPFRRALSYQAFRSFIMWRKHYGLTELPEDSDISVYNGDYKTTRAKYAQRLAQDCEEEKMGVFENDFDEV